MRRRISCFFFLAFCAAFWAYAEEIELTASVNSDRIGIEDRLQLTVTCKGVGNPPEPKLSSIRDFELIPGMVQRGTEFIMSNSGSTLLTRFVYQLRPRKKGKLSIPSLSIQVDGRQYKSKPIKVEVVAGKIPRTQGPVVRRMPGFFDDPMEDFFSRQTSWKPELFLRTNLSQKTVYLGEALLVRIELLTLDQVDEHRMLRAASIPGFWVEWADRQNLAPERKEEHDGRQYTVMEIDRGVFIPQSTGRQEIPPLEYAILVSQASARASFFSSRQQLSRKTSALPIDVLSLPAEAQGLPVGRFRFSLTASHKNIDISELLEISMRIEGRGNIRSVQPPKLPSIGGFKPFPAKIDRSNEVVDGELNAVLTAEIPVALSRAGQVMIPALTFRFFNPQSGEVEQSESDALEITVGGRPKQGESISLHNVDSVKKTGEDIDYLVDGSIANPRDGWLWHPFFFTLLFLPFLLPLLPFAHRLLLRFLARLATKKKGLKRWQTEINLLKKTGGNDEILPRLDHLLTVLLNLRPAELGRSAIERELIKQGCSIQISRRLLDHRDSLQASRFAATEMNEAAFRLVRDELVDILTQLIREMK